MTIIKQKFYDSDDCKLRAKVWFGNVVPGGATPDRISLPEHNRSSLTVFLGASQTPVFDYIYIGGPPGKGVEFQSFQHPSRSRPHKIIFFSSDDESDLVNGEIWGTWQAPDPIGTSVYVVEVFCSGNAESPIPPGL